MKLNSVRRLVICILFSASAMGETRADGQISSRLDCSALSQNPQKNPKFTAAVTFDSFDRYLRGERSTTKYQGKEVYVGTMNSSRIVKIEGRGAYYNGSNTWRSTFTGSLNVGSETVLAGSLETGRKGGRRDCSITFVPPYDKLEALLFPAPLLPYAQNNRPTISPEATQPPQLANGSPGQQQAHLRKRPADTAINFAERQNTAQENSIPQHPSVTRDFAAAGAAAPSLPDKTNSTYNAPPTAAPPSASFAFVIWPEGRTVSLGQISSREVICDRLRHPFFSHDIKDYPSLDWDPSNLGLQWLSDRLAAPRLPVMDVAPDTRKTIDENLRACLRILSTETPTQIQIIMRMLRPDENNDNASSCYSTGPTAVEQYMSPSGEIRQRTRSVPGQPCAIYVTINAGGSGVSRTTEFLLMLALDEAGPVLRSLLDANEVRMAKVESEKVAASNRGNEYAKRRETDWRNFETKDEMNDKSILTAVSNQKNGNGVAAEVKIKCENTKLKLTALIVDEEGKPTISLSTAGVRMGQRGVTGKIRRNEQDPKDTVFFLVDGFRNEIDITEALASGQNAGDIWRVLVSVQTGQGEMIMRIPIYQVEVRKVIEACH